MCIYIYIYWLWRIISKKAPASPLASHFTSCLQPKAIRYFLSPQCSLSLITLVTYPRIISTTGCHINYEADVVTCNLNQFLSAISKGKSPTFNSLIKNISLLSPIQWCEFFSSQDYYKEFKVLLSFYISSKIGITNILLEHPLKRQMNMPNKGSFFKGSSSQKVQHDKQKRKQHRERRSPQVYFPDEQGPIFFFGQ